MPCEMLPVAERTPDQYYASGGICGVSGMNAKDVVELAVALSFKVSLLELRASTRCKASVAFARQVAMYLMHVGCGFSLTEVGVLFGRDRTTVSYACGIIEDRRDDPGFDSSLENLEAAITKLTQASHNLQSAHS